MALHHRLPQCEHRSGFYYISKHRIPSGQRGERLRLSGSRVAALASERQHVLAEVI
jgi:hypothetical protein